MGNPINCIEALETRVARLENLVRQIQIHEQGPEFPADAVLVSDPQNRPQVEDTTGKQLVAIWSSLAADVKRIADCLDPPPGNLMGSAEIAKRLGTTTTWVAEMARNGTIPRSCLVEGTGNGKPWKFHRARIEEWLKTR
jgi:hypothetical protein